MTKKGKALVKFWCFVGSLAEYPSLTALICLVQRRQRHFVKAERCRDRNRPYWDIWGEEKGEASLDNTLSPAWWAGELLPADTMGSVSVHWVTQWTSVCVRSKRKRKRKGNDVRLRPIRKQVQKSHWENICDAHLRCTSVGCKQKGSSKGNFPVKSHLSVTQTGFPLFGEIPASCRVEKHLTPNPACDDN